MDFHVLWYWICYEELSSVFSVHLDLTVLMTTIWPYICMLEHLHVCSAYIHPVHVILSCSTSCIWEKAIWSTTFSCLAFRLFGVEKTCWWRFKTSDSYEVTQRQHYLLKLMNDLTLVLQNTVLGIILYSLFPSLLNDPDMGKRFFSSTIFIMALGLPNLLFSGYWDFFLIGCIDLGNAVD